MATLQEIQAKKDADKAGSATKTSNDKSNPAGTHRDGEASVGSIPMDQRQEPGQDVVVKNSVVRTGNEDNKVTAAVANDVANLAPDPTLAPMDAHMNKVQNSAGEAMMTGSVETVAANGAVIQSSQNPPIVASAEPSSVARTSNIDTGLEVSQPKYQGDSPINDVIDKDDMSSEVLRNLKEKAKGIYQAGNLKRVHRADGTALVPEKDGNFYAQTDAEFKDLEHHAKLGRVTKTSTDKKEAKTDTGKADADKNAPKK